MRARRSFHPGAWRAGSLSLVAWAALAVLAAPAFGQTTARTDAAPAPGRLADAVPARTLAYLEVADWQTLTRAIGRTRAKSVWGELSPFFQTMWDGLAPMREKAERQLQKNAGLSLPDLFAALRGGISVALLDVEARRGTPHVVAQIDTRGREAALESILQAIKKAAGPPREGAPGPKPIDHQGATIEAIGRPPIFLTRTPSALLVSSSPDDLKGVLDRQKAAGGARIIAASLAQAPDFIAASARTQAGKPVLGSLYVNLGSILDRFARPRMPEDGERAFRLLGGADLRALSIASVVEGDAMVSRLFLSAPTAGARGGLLGVLQHGKADRGLLALAPASSTGVVLGRFDLGAAWERAVKLVAGVEPRAQRDLDRATNGIDEKLGASLRQDLLASLGADHVTVSFPPPGGGLPESVTALRLKDPARFTAFMASVSTALHAPLAKRQIGRRTYSYLLAPLGRLGQDPFRKLERSEEAQVAYVALMVLGQTWTIQDGTLYAAQTPHALADYFELLETGGPITGVKAFQDALAQAPQGAQVLAYTDPTRYFGGGYGLVVTLLKLVEPTVRAAGIPMDVNRLPRARDLARHLRPGMDSVTLDGDGLAIETRASSGIDVATTGAAVGAILAAIAVPNLIEARKGANEAAAIATLKTLVVAQALYRDADKDGDGKANFAASLRDLQRHGNLIGDVLATGRKNGYRFTMQTSADGFSFQVTAEPQAPGKSGDRSFFIDETGVLRFEMGRPAKATSTPIGD